MYYYQDGPVIKVERLARTPIEDDVTGGFDGRYGTFAPSSPDPDYQQDMLDQLANRPLGANTNTNADEYEMPNEEPYNGAVYSAADFPGGSWPADSDLAPAQALAWLRARGDTFTADVLDETLSQVGLL